MNENDIARIIVNEAFQLHKKAGVGLLESVYETILARRLEACGLSVSRQHPVPVQLDGVSFEEAFRADLIVNDLVIVEIKAVDRTIAVHKRQLLTYLRMSGKRLGLLINFGEPYFKEAVSRVVNALPDEQQLEWKSNQPQFET